VCAGKRVATKTLGSKKGYTNEETVAAPEKPNASAVVSKGQHPRPAASGLWAHASTKRNAWEKANKPRTR